MRRALVATVMLGTVCSVPAVAAPRVIGHRECEKCHKPAINKWAQEEVTQFGAEAHANTHKQLADPKSAAFAAAIGASATDPNGRCAGCHATVVRNRIRSGVSCESCHGPASDYLDPHDDEPWAASYKKSIPLGLADLHGKTAAIAKMCVDCHVTPEPALAAAGHPNGADFDAGASLRKIVHWTAAFTPNQQVHATYDFAKVTADARPLVDRRLAGGGGGGGRRASGGGGAASAGGGGAAAAAPAVAAAAPWDWDSVQPLPDDYPSDEDRPAPTPPPPPPPPVAVPSIAVDEPVAFDSLPAFEADPAPAESGPPRPASRLAELRGRAATLLAELLAAGTSTPGIDEPPPPSEFQGPDGELLHIQDVVLYLALETLRSRE